MDSRETPEFRLGTDDWQPPTGSGDWWIANTTGFALAIHKFWDKLSLGVMAKVGPDGVRGMYPSGVAHAVPMGTERALCGKTGLHIWDGRFDSSSRVTTACPECETLVDAD